jgi:putative transcriptional regulator
MNVEVLPMLKWKIDILFALRDAGYNSTKIRREKLMGQQMLTKLRNGELPSWSVMDDICEWLHCQPGDLIEHVSETDE